MSSVCLVVRTATFIAHGVYSVPLELPARAAELPVERGSSLGCLPGTLLDGCVGRALDACGGRGGGFGCLPSVLDACAIVASHSEETASIRVASASGSSFTISRTSTLTVHRRQLCLG